jgi:SHS family lactate transporter-like MFS transporter
MGAEWTSGTTLVMESWPARSRGIASGALQGSWAIGYVLAAAASAVVVPAFGWRALFVVAALPALLVLPIRLWVPESAAWTAGAGRRDRARGIPTPRAPWGRIAWASLFLGASFAIFYGLTSLWPTLLQVGVRLPPARVSWLVILFNAGMLAGCVGCGAAAGRVGVLPALVVPICLNVAALPLYLGAAPDLLPLGALAAGTFGAGIAGVTPLLLARLFRPEVRARASGVVYHVGALLAAPVPALVAWLSAGGRMPLAHAMASAVAGSAALTLVALLVAWRVLPPEVLAPAPAERPRAP